MLDTWGRFQVPTDSGIIQDDKVLDDDALLRALCKQTANNS